jgi:hypothetical protein
MTTVRTLLFGTAVLCLATPALAGDHYRWWTDQSVDTPWTWVCGAFEYRHRCNAEFHPRTNRCGCIVR